MRLYQSSLAVVTLLALPFAGAAPRLAAEDVDTEALYKKVVKSCVFIVTPLKGGFAMGSGSLIDVEKKLVLTNYHVVDQENIVFILFPVFNKDGVMLTDREKYMELIPADKSIKGKVLCRDKSRDLALVELDRVPADTPAIPLAKKSPNVASTCWNIGSPEAVKQVFGVTQGKVRAVGYEERDIGGGSSVIKLRAKMVTATNPANPGDSGGPLFDKRGYQVAVTESVSTRASLVNFFVDVTEVWALLAEKKIKIKELAVEPAEKTDDKADRKKNPLVESKPEPKKDGVVATLPKENGTATPPPVAKDTPPAASAADETIAANKLRSAKLFSGTEEQKDVYIQKLKEIVAKYPATAAGKEAKKLLDAIK
jgi:S1-C subfamily serine protease